MLDQLVGQFGPPDHARVDLLVVPEILDHPRHGGLREPGAGILDQPRHHLDLPGVDQRLRDHLGQPLPAGDRQRVLHGVGAYHPHQVLVAEHRAVLKDRTCDLDPVGRELPRDVRRQQRAGRHRRRQRLPHLDRKVADQKPEHGIGDRPVAAGAEFVELPAELGRDLRPCMGGAVALEGVDIGRAQTLLALPVRMVPQQRLAPAPAHRHSRRSAHPCPTIRS